MEKEITRVRELISEVDKTDKEMLDALFVIGSVLRANLKGVKYENDKGDKLCVGEYEINIRKDNRVWTLTLYDDDHYCAYVVSSDYILNLAKALLAVDFKKIFEERIKELEAMLNERRDVIQKLNVLIEELS